LSHTSCPVFGDGILQTICLDWPQTTIPLFSASQGICFWVQLTPLVKREAIRSCLLLRLEITKLVLQGWALISSTEITVSRWPTEPVQGAIDPLVKIF
jgi:hypothetical protein